MMLPAGLRIIVMTFALVVPTFAPVSWVHDALASERKQTAFLHEGPPHYRSKGCFFTTPSKHQAQGVRRGRKPCPLLERKRLDPYHPPRNRHHADFYGRQS